MIGQTNRQALQWKVVEEEFLDYLAGLDICPVQRRGREAEKEEERKKKSCRFQNLCPYVCSQESAEEKEKGRSIPISKFDIGSISLMKLLSKCEHKWKKE